MKTVIMASVLATLLLGAPAFAASFPPVKGSGGGWQTERTRTEGRHDGRDHGHGQDHDRDREHHRVREHVRIFVIPTWNPYWGSTYAAPAPAVVFPPPAAPQPPAYWYYCPDPPGYYPYTQECPGGWMTVMPPSAPPGA
jgi:hypothetical protein